MTFDKKTFDELSAATDEAFTPVSQRGSARPEIKLLSTIVRQNALMLQWLRFLADKD